MVEGKTPVALIVDPDDARATQYATALDTVKIQAACVADSKTAIRFCQEQKIDLLVCCVILDGALSGYELLSAISEEEPVQALMISSFPLVLIRSVRGFDQSIPLVLAPFTARDLAIRVVELLDGLGNQLELLEP